MREPDAKIQVIEQMLALLRVVRRKGTPAKSVVAAEYEMKFERELAARQHELGIDENQSPLPLAKELTPS